MNFEDDNTIKLDDSEMVALGSKEQSVSIKCIALGGLLCPENRRQALLQEIADLGKRRQQRGWMCIMGLGTTFDPDFTVQHQLLGRIERVDAVAAAVLVHEIENEYQIPHAPYIREQL